MIKFIKAYIKSMRLYYAFVTGIAGWVGVVFYDYITKTNISLVSDILISQKKIIILVFLFLSWGINQIFNDYLGLKEDRINAPNRPMVTGELNAKAALLVSTLLLIGVGIITYVYLQPIAIMPLVVGVLLNIVYEYAKGYGILGNIVFGVMIGNCTVYGYLVSGGNRQYLFFCHFFYNTYHRASVCIYIYLHTTIPSINTIICTIFMFQNQILLPSKCVYLLHLLQ
jgi:geranylgeranylglycerol-phosphate geranylgeranyltransferase